MNRFKSSFFVLTLSLLAVFGVSAFAQTGSITGQVLDPTGRAVINATLTATSTATGLTQTVTSSSAGVYNFAALPPSSYDVTVTATGFATSTRNSVVLTIAQVLALNFKLGVGSANQTVKVAADQGAPVETQTSELSTVIDSQQINDLPLILRDPYQLVLLSPGVVTSTNNIGGFSVNGQRDRNNNFLLDGADNNDTSVPGAQGGISSANPDSAQEFRVITNNFDAEYGRNTGAIIDVLTRGGTNAFHGDAYEFGRYNALGARDFFNTKENGPQNPYVRNDFGASVGGPAWKDHTFFFLNGEAQRFRTTTTAFQTTPTAAFKSGVFTYTDPVDGTQTFVDLTNPANPNNLTGLPRDPVVARILALAPVGQSDLGDGVSTIYAFASPDSLNSYSFTGRFDQKLTEKHQLTVRYQYSHSNESDPFHDEVLPGYGTTSVPATTHNGVISIASSLGVKASNLFRAGYNLNNAAFLCDHKGIDAVTGLDNFGNGRDVDIPYFFTLGCVDLGDSNGQARLSSTLLLADTFSLTQGAHSLRFGGEFRDVKDTDFDNFYSRNLLALNDFTTYNVPAYNSDPNAASYLNLQDLIWGATGAIANSSEYQFFSRAGVRRPTDTTRFVQREFGIFFQDDWKISRKFTANLGFRYEFNGVPYERDGNFSNFFGDASASLPSVGYFSFTPVGPGTGRQLYSDSWKLLEPRIGFAYDPNGDGKTAIRAGFGIFHDRIFDNLFGNAKSNPPFQASLNEYPLNLDPNGNFIPGTPTPVVASAPLPGNLTPSANITNGDFNEPVTIDPHLKIPGSQTWNLGVQRELGRGFTAEIDYVGSHGTHLLREIDGAPPQPALVQQLIASGVDPSSLQFNNLYFAGATNNTAFFHDLLQTAIASSNYNAAQIKVTQRLGGFSLLGSYTFAHSLDDGSDPLAPGAGNSGLPRDTFNIKAEYGNSPFDVRQRGTAAIVYALPIGHGEQFLSNGVLGRIFEGIQLSGIQQVQTGLPFDLRGTRDNLHTGLTNRPQLVGKAYPSGRGTIVSGGKITGPSAGAFANAPFDVPVSIGRNAYYGPGFVNTDVVFQKTQSLIEGVKVVFRAESYNVLNHPNFASPAALTFTSPQFGISTSQLGQNDGTTGARQIQGALKVVF
jgi:Carboxypeptidase regulatory-like domain